MSRPDPSEYPAYYSDYVAAATEQEVMEALERNLIETMGLLSAIGEAQGDHRYAPEKWSVKEVVGHLADCERIFGYRALRMALVGLLWCQEISAAASQEQIGAFTGPYILPR